MQKSTLCSQWVVGWGAPRDMTRWAEVIAIFGPTASGKSAVADSLAGRLGTEVVSADAWSLPWAPRAHQPADDTDQARRDQGSRRRDVGGRVQALAHAAVDELVESSGSAVVAGGTGLYLRAALVDLAVPPSVEPGLRTRVEESYDSSAALAHARLQELDPRAGATVHPNDRRRVVRALELAESGSSLIPQEDRLWSGSIDERP